MQGETLLRFTEFTKLMKELAQQGKEKYAGAGTKENIDVIPDILGEEGFLHFVLGDLVKRIIRFKNQRRERDLVKMALWSYLLWTKLFPVENKTEKEV